MIILGEVAVKRGLITNLFDSARQVQSLSVDLTLRSVQTWRASGALGFNHRERALTQTLRFPRPGEPLRLTPGAYNVEFNEVINVPSDMVAYISSRHIAEGIMLSGSTLSNFRGHTFAILQVLNPHGIALYNNARVGKIEFHTDD